MCKGNVVRKSTKVYIVAGILFWGMAIMSGWILTNRQGTVKGTLEPVKDKEVFREWGKKYPRQGIHAGKFDTDGIVSVGETLFLCRESAQQTLLYGYQWENDTCTPCCQQVMPVNRGMYVQGNKLYYVTEQSTDGNTNTKTVVWESDTKSDALAFLKSISQTGTYCYSGTYRGNLCVASWYCLPNGQNQRKEKAERKPMVENQSIPFGHIYAIRGYEVNCCLVITLLSKDTPGKILDSKCVFTYGNVHENEEGVLEVQNDEYRLYISYKEDAISMKWKEYASKENEVHRLQKAYPYDRSLTLEASLLQKTGALSLKMMKETVEEPAEEMNFHILPVEFSERNSHILSDIVVDHQRGFIGVPNRDKIPGYGLYRYRDGVGFERLWEVASRQEYTTYKSEYTGWIRGNRFFVFSPDGKEVQSVDLTSIT